MTHESLKLFRDIAHSKSFSKAAASSDISQSAASQQIQEIERTLGAILVDRSTRPLGITEAGQLFADYCRDALRLKEEFDAALARLKQDMEGEIRVASIYSIGLSEIAQIEKEYSRRLPHAKLLVDYLRPEKVYAAVLADEADLGLVSYPEGSREITVIPWRQEEMTVVAAPDHPLAKQALSITGPIPAAWLNGIDFVAFDDDLPIRHEIDRFFREHDLEVNEAAHFDNVQMVKEAVALKKGVSILPLRVIREDVRQKRLTSIRIAGCELYRPLGIVHRRKKRFTQVAQAFLDLLQEKPTPEMSAV